MNRFDFHKYLNSNLIDSIPLCFASKKTGNDLVTEVKRKPLNFAFFNLRQLRTTSTYLSIGIGA
jgi:hypothetical protein